MPLLGQEHQESVAKGSASYDLHAAREPIAAHQNGVVSHRRMVQMLLTSLPLVIADLVALIAANLMVFAVISLFSEHPGIEILPLVFLLCGPFIAINTTSGLYPGTGLNPVLELRQTTITTALLYLTFMASAPLHHQGAALFLFLGMACFLTMVLIPAARSGARRCFSRFKWWGQPVLVLGNNSSAEFFTKALNSNPRFGLRPIVLAEEHQSLVIAENENGFDRKNARHASSARPIDDVSYAIVAMPNWPALQILGEYNGSLSRVVTVPDHSDIPTIGNRMCDLAVLDSFCLKRKLLIKSPAIKRAMDILFVLCCGLFIMPVVAIIALLIKLDSRGPLIYGQRRIGRKGREFRAWKFRTMVLDADRLLEQYLAADPQLRKEWQMDHKLKNDPRVTKVGRWLRKTSLDELPQFWNILVGEMSLVGPRAIVEAEIPKYGESFELYKAVLPGLTGLWQVSGRNNTTYSERVQLDNYYVRHWSFWLDLYIVARTSKVVFGAEGAY